MRNKIWIYFLVMTGLVIIANSGCKKDKNDTPVQVPVLSTSAITEITDTTALCGGKIVLTDNAGITEKGICWSTGSPPTIADNKKINEESTDSYTSILTDLNPNTTYYVRVYATNIAGTGYGATMTFESLEKGTVTDIDGNLYHTVKIGTQTWMVENLKVTRYNDGTEIPLATEIWGNETTPAYCWYDNNEAENKDPYGALYNWYAAQSDKISPKGWHVSTSEDWQTLIDHIGGLSFAGNLKETDTAHWMSPNTEATNNTGFTALPGGSRGLYFAQKGYVGNWWSSSSTLSLFLLTFDAGELLVNTNTIKYGGCSIRCVKD